MATNVSYNGVTYSVPQNANSGWGTSLTAYLVALASGSLTKAGGLVALTADLDLGANYGIKSIFFSDRGTAASAGVVRLSNNTSVAWRNAANDGNLNLTVTAGNLLQFNSANIVTLANGAANTVLKMNSGGTAYEYGTLLNANINASAAIDGSKLVAATGSVAGAVSTSAQTFAGLKTLKNGVNTGAAGTQISGVRDSFSIETTTGAVQFAKYATTSNGMFLYLARANGSAASPAILADTEEIGGMYFYGYGVSSFNLGASIRAIVDGEPGTAGDLSDMPTRLSFSTSANGSSTPTERMNIAPNGAITYANLAGTGTRMVTADTNGLLAASSIVTSGVYTPSSITLSNATGGTIRPANYIRVGQTVYVSGSIEGITTTTTGTDVAVTINELPVTTANFTTTYQASGTGNYGRNSGGIKDSCSVFAVASSQTVQILVESTTAATGGTSCYVYYSYSYQIQ
jgi:hypothetical protein